MTQCDVCGKMSDDIKTIVAYGLDTDACAECRGEEKEDQDNDASRANPYEVRATYR